MAVASVADAASARAERLTIGVRQGSFPGMLASRTFRVVWVSPGHGVDVPNTPNPDAVVTSSQRAHLDTTTIMGA